MKITEKRSRLRAKRKLKIRSRVAGSSDRPRLSVFRSARHIYVQAIDDQAGRTIASAATTEKGLAEYGGNLKAAKVVGQAIASRLQEKGISKVVFDRNGFLYHGRVKALAEAAREAGLQF
ncbi:MAG: 50S ribosomal protein L18 [Deltaproteobacteria bacterium]|nr:50S ribosomal protein L18 [Deltaproteobacteria bacterium]